MCLVCLAVFLGLQVTGMQGHGWRGGHAPFSFPEDTSVSWATGRFCLLDEQQIDVSLSNNDVSFCRWGGIGGCATQTQKFAAGGLSVPRQVRS